MAVYIINYLSLPVYAKIFSRKKFVVIVSIQMFFILALRAENLGVDLPMYQYGFNYIYNMSFSDMISSLRVIQNARLPYPMSFESGWVALNWFSSHIGFSFHAFLVLCAGINMISCGIFIYRYSEMPWLSFAIISSMNIYAYMFGILRQSLALSIIVIALILLDEEKKWQCFVLFLLAFLIHRTAILSFPLFFLMKQKSIKKNTFSIAVLIWPIFVLVSHIIYSNVIEKAMVSIGIGYLGHGLKWNNQIGLLIIICIAIIALYDFEQAETRMQCISIGSTIVALYWGAIGMYNDVLSRSMQYFVFFITISIPEVLNHFWDERVVRLGKFFAFILLFLFMINNLQDSDITPYRLVGF